MSKGTERKLIVGLDIGTSNVKAVVGELLDDNSEIEVSSTNNTKRSKCKWREIEEIKERQRLNRELQSYEIDVNDV